MVSLSAICNWNNSWFKASNTFMLLQCSSSMVSTSSKVISIPELLTSSLGYPCKDWMVYGRRVQSRHPTWWYTVKSHLQLWYVTASFATSSLEMGKLIFMWGLVSLCHLPCQECQEPSNLSDWWYWWGCQHWTPIAFKSMIWWRWGWLGVVSASDPLNANHDPSLLVACGAMVDG